MKKIRPDAIIFLVFYWLFINFYKTLESSARFSEIAANKVETVIHLTPEVLSRDVNAK